MGAIPLTSILGETDQAQTMSCRASRMRSETSSLTRRGQRTRSLSSILRGNFAGDATGRRRRAPKTAFPRGSVGTSKCSYSEPIGERVLRQRRLAGRDEGDDLAEPVGEEDGRDGD